MTQPRDKKRRQKKKVARKTKAKLGAPLPKSVQSLLKYLSGSNTGVGGGVAPPSQPAATLAFQQAAPQLPQPQGAAAIRNSRARKTAASEVRPSPLSNIVPQQTLSILQLPATAPQQETAASREQVATLQETAKQQAGAINELKRVVQHQGTEMLFKSMQGGGASYSLPSQAPSYLQRPPSAPSWAGKITESSSASIGDRNRAFLYTTPGSVYPSNEGARTIMRNLQGHSFGGEPEFISARQSIVSEAEHISSASVFENEAAGLGEFFGGQYIQNVTNPAIQEQRMGRGGRVLKTEAEKKATRAAAYQRRKEEKQQQQQQTHAESLASLANLGATTSASSVVTDSSNRFSFMAKGRGQGKAQEVLSRAQAAGVDPSTTIRAMVSGGGAAQHQGQGYSLGELQGKKQRVKKK
jgi:hypothetical protein